MTLEADLARRDLTMNAIALDDQGAVIDPFGGRDDLEAGILRHVGPAFAEDPVRILRVARFAARFGFRIAPETLALMAEMVDSGEVGALVPERVWQELARGLMTERPARMFLVLRDCGALARILPEVEGLFTVPPPPGCPEPNAGLHAMKTIDCAAAASAVLPVRFAALALHFGKARTPSAQWADHPGYEVQSVEAVRELCARIRVPNDCRDLALIAARHCGNVQRAIELDSSAILQLLEAGDAFRRPERFDLVLATCEADFRVCAGSGGPCSQAERLQRALAAGQGVDAAALAAEGSDKESIRDRLHRHRLAAIEQAVSTPGS